MLAVLRALEIVAVVWIFGWLPLAVILQFALFSQVKPGCFTWRIPANPLGAPKAALTPLGQKLLTALRWTTALGLASWLLLGLAATLLSWWAGTL